MTSCLPTPEDGRVVDFLQVSPTPPVLFRLPLLPAAPDLPCRVFLERRLSRETGAVIMTAGISVQFDFSERHHRAIVRRRTGFDRMDSNGDCRKAGRPRPVTGGQSSRMDALQNQVLFLEAERRRRLELRSEEHKSELQSLMRI